MGSFANTFFTGLMGWMQSVASALWSLFTNEKASGVLRWIGDHWVVLAAVLCGVGLIADLGIYLVRWRPYLVWKSFLKRGQDAEDDEEKETTAEKSLNHVLPPLAVPAREVRRKEQATSAAEQTQEDELGRWMTEPEPPRNVTGNTAQPLVTAAGYVVPEDSPYRRPDVKKKKPEPPVEREDPQNKNNLRIQPSRRRKRINVNDLFSSPEEEIYEFDAPQNLIDRNKAYREPVYPRGWNRKEEKEE